MLRNERLLTEILLFQISGIGDRYASISPREILSPCSFCVTLNVAPRPGRPYGPSLPFAILGLRWDRDKTRPALALDGIRGLANLAFASHDKVRERDSDPMGVGADTPPTRSCMAIMLTSVALFHAATPPDAAHQFNAVALGRYPKDHLGHHAPRVAAVPAARSGFQLPICPFFGLGQERPQAPQTSRRVMS